MKNIETQTSIWFSFNKLMLQVKIYYFRSGLTIKLALSLTRVIFFNKLPDKQPNGFNYLATLLPNKPKESIYICLSFLYSFKA